MISCREITDIALRGMSHYGVDEEGANEDNQIDLNLINHETEKQLPYIGHIIELWVLLPSNDTKVSSQGYNGHANRSFVGVKINSDRCTDAKPLNDFRPLT